MNNREIALNVGLETDLPKAKYLPTSAMVYNEFQLNKGQHHNIFTNYIPLWMLELFYESEKEVVDSCGYSAE